MNFKIVYILISDNKDFYTEQAMVSMHSLKMHNPAARITLITNNKTLQSICNGRERIKDYISEVICHELPETFTSTQKNRFLKTSLRSLIEGDFLYLDNDTLINSNIEELSNFKCEVAAVSDFNKRQSSSSQLLKYKSLTHSKFINPNIYFNGGVLYVKDSQIARNFFTKWHNKWLNDLNKFKFNWDQPALAFTNKDSVITELPGEYNCQFMDSEGYNLLNSAKILHYFSDQEYEVFFPLKNINFLCRIREQGITPDVEFLISNPLYFVYKCPKLLKEEELKIYNSPMSVLGRKLSRDYPWSNRMAKFIYKIAGFKI